MIAEFWTEFVKYQENEWLWFMSLKIAAWKQKVATMVLVTKL